MGRFTEQRRYPKYEGWVKDMADEAAIPTIEHRLMDLRDDEGQVFLFCNSPSFNDITKAVA